MLQIAGMRKQQKWQNILWRTASQSDHHHLVFVVFFCPCKHPSSSSPCLIQSSPLLLPTKPIPHFARILRALSCHKRATRDASCFEKPLLPEKKFLYSILFANPVLIANGAVSYQEQNYISFILRNAKLARKSDRDEEFGNYCHRTFVTFAFPGVIHFSPLGIPFFDAHSPCFSLT